MSLTHDYQEAADEIERLRQQVTQRGARMQVMRVWMGRVLFSWAHNDSVWKWFLKDYPEAADWFDGDKVPSRRLVRRGKSSEMRVIEDYHLLLAKKDAEIERLRAKLERAHTMWQDVRIELKRLQEYYEPDPGNCD